VALSPFTTIILPYWNEYLFCLPIQEVC
jgi:hypothetical protein